MHHTININKNLSYLTLIQLLYLILFRYESDFDCNEDMFTIENQINFFSYILFYTDSINHFSATPAEQCVGPETTSFTSETNKTTTGSTDNVGPKDKKGKFIS